MYIVVDRITSLSHGNRISIGYIPCILPIPKIPYLFCKLEGRWKRIRYIVVIVLSILRIIHSLRKHGTQTTHSSTFYICGMNASHRHPESKQNQCRSSNHTYCDASIRRHGEILWIVWFSRLNSTSGTMHRAGSSACIRASRSFKNVRLSSGNQLGRRQG